jgi:hypothetical protein
MIMGRKAMVVALVGTFLVMVAAPAQAGRPPVRETIRFDPVVEAFVPECDRTLRWDIHGVSRVTTFFDEQGNVAKTVAKVTERNTITDVTNGVTLREGPDAFTQTTTFNPDGTQIVEINGLSAIVVGGASLVIDVGRLKLLIHPDRGQSRVLHESGRHDIRGLDPFTLTADPLHLKGFCPAFA